jgi:quercetin dioxygenase-like cupin family protein
MLSKIESGSVYPSVASLVRIATALGTNVSALMEKNGKDHPSFVRRAQAESSLTKTEKGYSIFPYATEFDHKKMQPFLFVVKKGQVKRHAVSHPGEEFICVLEGEILFKVGDTEFRMRAGDSLFFNSLDEHGVMPLTDVAKYIDVFV